MQQGLPVDQMDQVVVDTFYSPMNNGICESDFSLKTKGASLSTEQFLALELFCLTVKETEAYKG